MVPAYDKFLDSFCNKQFHILFTFDFFLLMIPRRLETQFCQDQTTSRAVDSWPTDCRRGVQKSPSIWTNAFLNATGLQK